MNVLIMSGGTGSIALKTGLSKYICENRLFTLVNAYDNGLSTGLVRQVFNGQILGPSDVRKQQFLDFNLYVQNRSENSKKIISVLDKRFTVETCNAKQYVESLIYPLGNKILNDAVSHFFKQPKSSDIRYNDFSLANIIYSAIASLNNNSIQTAADIMADVLGMCKNIIVNDDTSLFLGAITENGEKIFDEGVIVCWSNPNNKIIDIFFTDVSGNITNPVLSDKSKNIFASSHVVIASSGTQWSSLIPTYKSVCFEEAFRGVKHKYAIKNVSKDCDMTGVSDEEEIKIMKQYLPQTKIISHKDNVGVDIMNSSVVSKTNINKHDSDVLSQVIMNDIFGDLTKYETLICDYDDTLMARNCQLSDISNMTIKFFCALGKRIETIVCTGKNIKDLEIEKLQAHKYYCDYGMNEYDSTGKFVKCLSEKHLFKPSEINSIMDSLHNIEFNFCFLENRGGVIISMRQLEKSYRNVLCEYMRMRHPDLLVIKSGKATIDIMHQGVSKKYILNEISIDKAMYIGDEAHGNDKDIFNSKIKSFEVIDPQDTYSILRHMICEYLNMY